jgi:hypothetical protein
LRNDPDEEDRGRLEPPKGSRPVGRFVS